MFSCPNNRRSIYSYDDPFGMAIKLFLAVKVLERFGYIVVFTVGWHLANYQLFMFKIISHKHHETSYIWLIPISSKPSFVLVLMSNISLRDPFGCLEESARAPFDSLPHGGTAGEGKSYTLKSLLPSSSLASLECMPVG